MRSIFGLFTGLCIVSLCEVVYLRVIIIMHIRHIDKNKTKHRVPGLPMVSGRITVVASATLALYLAFLAHSFQCLCFNVQYHEINHLPFHFEYQASPA